MANKINFAFMQAVLWVSNVTFSALSANNKLVFDKMECVLCRVKGHMQVVFGKRNPLFCSNLKFKERLFYTMANWSFFVVAISTPVFLVVPMIIIWFGVFPIDINESFAPFLVMYYSVLMLTVYLTRSASHTYQFWLGWVSNGIYWYTILKSILNVIVATILGKTMTFKPTTKKAVNPEAHKGDDASSTPSNRSQATEGSVEGKSTSNLNLFKTHLTKKGMCEGMQWM